MALQQVSSPFARENADRTLHKPVALKFVWPYVSEEVAALLDAACPTGAARIWGSKRERRHQTVRILPRQCIFLFRRGRIIYNYGIVVGKTENPQLAEKLWGADVDGETWSTVYFFRRLGGRPMTSERANELLGRKVNDNWQGLVVKEMDEDERAIEFFERELARAPR